MSTQCYTALIKSKTQRDQRNQTVHVCVKSIITVRLKGVLGGISANERIVNLSLQTVLYH